MPLSPQWSPFLMSMACFAGVILSWPLKAATTVFDHTFTGTAGSTFNRNFWDYDANGDGTVQDVDGSVRTQDIVHQLSFYADSTITWDTSKWYVLWEAGGSGTGSAVLWQPLTIGPHAALGAGNHITSSQIAFLAGGGNNQAVIVPLNYTYSSSNIDIVAAYNRDGSGANTDDNYLFVQGDRTNFSSYSQQVAQGVDTDTSNSWAGTNGGGVGTPNSSVQGDGVTFAATDRVALPAAAFPGLTYNAHILTNGAGTGPRAIDFAMVDDVSSSMFAFGFLTPQTIPEPSRAVLVLLGVTPTLLRRRRDSTFRFVGSRGRQVGREV